MPVTPPILTRSQSAGPQDHLVRPLLAILAILVCYQSYYCWSEQKSLGWDASMGFLTLQSSLEHGDFNRIRHPSPANLTENRAEFIAWWTPGQYLIPHWIAQLLGADIGVALRIVSLVCSLAGLAGCCLLYAKLGFNRLGITLSLIVVCSQHFFLKSGKVYSGGDLLLFSVSPYIALGVLCVRPLAWRALFVALACFAALFLKASALTLFLSLMLYLACEIHGWPGTRQVRSGFRGAGLRSLVVLGGIVAFYGLVTHLGYLSQGVTISSSAKPLDSFTLERLWGIPVALAGPLYGAFSFLESFHTSAFYIPVAGLSLLVVSKWRAGSEPEQLHNYRRMFVATYLAFVLFFSFAYLVGMGISYEPRHFRFLGLLLVPGLIGGLLSHARPILVSVVIVAVSLVSVVFYHLENNSGARAEESASRWGIRQPVSNASLAAMHRIDQTYVTHDTIVFNGFGACPALLLEFNHGRRLQDDNWVYFGFKNYTGRATTPLPWYRNAAESIVLIVPKNDPWYFGASLDEIRRTFERPLHVVPYFENSELTLYVGSAR